MMELDVVTASGAASAAEVDACASEDQQQQLLLLGNVPRGPIPHSFLVLAEALDGSFCPLVNDLAQQLVQQLLLLHEEHPCLFPDAEAKGVLGAPGAGPLFSLEVEGRLGVIREKDGGARLQLPTTTHAVLQPSFCVHVGAPGGAGDPQARFAAGISAAQFDDLKSFLLALVSRAPRAADQRLHAHLALMGIEPGAGALGGPHGGLKGVEGKGTPGSTPQGPLLHLSGDDWRVLPQQETEENYYHIPALQAAARFRSIRGPLTPGGPGHEGAPRGGPFGGPPSGPPVSVQSLSQVLASPGIYKKSLLQWNVYTGADKDEAFRPTNDEGPHATEDTAERTRVDYRLAINFEHKIEVKELQRALASPLGNPPTGPYGARGGPGTPSTEPQLRRLRQRQSLVHRSGLRIDLTKVQQHGRQGWGQHGDNRKEMPGRWLYEVEIELHPAQIAKAILYKQQTGDPRPLWCLCATFLSLLRELAAPLNSSLGAHGGAGKGAASNSGVGVPSEAEWADLRDVQASERERATFMHFLSDTIPLIGDYAYRAVAKRFEENNEKEEVVPSLEEFLKTPDVETRCLYTYNKTEVPGPWIPHRDADGRVHLVEVKKQQR